MARTRTATPPPPDPEREPIVATDPEPVEAPALPERRLSLREYARDARLDVIHQAILTALHPTTKATTDEWDALLRQALTRPIL